MSPATASVAHTGADAHPAPDTGRVPLPIILAYASSGAGVAFMMVLVSVYLVKYSTDVLLIAPATIGIVFGLSRLWDAVSDPLVGHWSDRTRHRWGRRRLWMLASLPLLAGFFAMCWLAPAGLSGAPLVAWMAVAVFGLYTATTAFSVPHASLGAELTPDHHERSRVFGARYVGVAAGLLAAPVGLYFLTASDDPRATAGWIALAAAVATAGLVLPALPRLPEPGAHQDRGGERVLGAYADVARNPYARSLLALGLAQGMGTGAMAVVAPYVVTYVLGEPELLAAFMPFYFVPNLLSIPFWVRTSRRFGKRQVWVVALTVNALAFGGLFFASASSAVWMCALAAVAGFAGGCGEVMGPSLLADAIDFDEWRTGQRKEGSYFAAGNFVSKTAGGITAMLAGLVLQWVDFQPNVEQGELAKLAMRAMLGLLPLACLTIGVVILLRFRLDAAEHARIRSALDARSASSRAGRAPAPRKETP